MPLLFCATSLSRALMADTEIGGKDSAVAERKMTDARSQIEGHTQAGLIPHEY